jgi:hypothetical protein
MKEIYLVLHEVCDQYGCSTSVVGAFKNLPAAEAAKLERQSWHRGWVWIDEVDVDES